MQFLPRLALKNLTDKIIDMLATSAANNLFHFKTGVREREKSLPAF